MMKLRGGIAMRMRDLHAWAEIDFMNNVRIIRVKVVELGFANFANNGKRRRNQTNITVSTARTTVAKSNSVTNVRLCGQFRLQKRAAKDALVGDNQAANAQHTVLATKAT
jgi:hypothetical protein